jgi:hypothetical protein
VPEKFRRITRRELTVKAVARIAIDDFGDKAIARIYFAARLSEAQLVETELNKHKIDYAVEVELYLASAVFWLSEQKGAAFYVLAGQADFCARVLNEAGLIAGLLEKEFQ